MPVRGWRNATRQPIHISPIGEARLVSSSVTLDFPAGAFPQPGDATLTELTPQTLPYPLPAGWSPLAQFHLGLTGEPSQPGSAALKLRGPLAPGESAVLTKFNPILFKWEVVAIVTGDGTNNASAQIGSSGACALAVRDTGPTAPPVADVGGTLEAATGPVDTSGATATGTVTPAVSSASRDAALVTATARVTFNNSTPVPSGTLFVTAVSEKYELNGGGSAAVPDYDTTIFAYQRPGNVLTAEFPMRPQLLFGPEELKEATVHAEVLNAQAFSGGVIDNSGGQLGKDGVHVVVPADAFPSAQPAEISTRDPQSFVGLTGGVVPIKAFTLNLGTLAAGSSLGFAVDGLEPNTNFVLGVVVSDGSSRGVTPLQRFISDATGRLTSAEPTTGPRLPGINGAGDYVLIKLAGPLALVEGIARDATGNPVAGLAVRTSGQPWLVFSAADGSYKTLAGLGNILVTVIDPRDGNEGSASIVVNDPAQSQHVDLSTAPTPPRVASTDPAANATGVRRVTPITVTFSEPITSASFGGDGVVVRDASNNVVPAALTLNRAGTVATLLPANPLAAGVQFQIEVSAAIKDSSGLALAGDRLFTFTTAPEGPRPPGAQLIIYEPGAANVPAEALIGYNPATDKEIVVVQGTPGVADPRVAVILVNETTGETATVSSKADGSFVSHIRGSEEDLVSATFVNANGTRVNVPVQKQMFDDGRVGLYPAGGILEAQSDGGPVQVIIEPEAISRRTKFKLETGALAEVLDFLQGALPENATIIAGVKFSAEGDPLQQSGHVVFPIAPENLALPPGTPPEQGQFVLTRLIEVDGVKVNEVIDSMSYRDGALRTASPPFLGLVGTGLLAISTFPTQSAVVTGRVVIAPEGTSAAAVSDIVSIAADGTTTTNSSAIFKFPPLPGATVGFNSAETLNSNVFTLRPGAFMARTNAAGFYALKVPVVNDDPIAVFAQSILFPGRKPGGPAVRDRDLPTAGQSEVRIKNLAFITPSSTTGDKVPPLLTLEQPFQVLSVDFPTVITLHMFDNASPPSLQSVDWVQATPGSGDKFSFALADGLPLLPADVIFTRSNVATPRGPNAADSTVTVTVKKSAVLIVRATAVDQSGNARTREFQIMFGPNLPAPNNSIQPSDPQDSIPPRVTSIRPGPNEVVSSFSEIVITFSEAVSQDIETLPGTVGVFGSISNGVPVKVELASDHLSAIVRPIGLQPGDDVNIGLTPMVRDLNGNPLDAFSSNFKIAGLSAYPLAGSEAVAATVAAGQFTYSLRRPSDTNAHELLIHQLGDPAMNAPIGKLSLPPFPRALAYVPKFAFKRRPQASVEQKPLLVISGGLLGIDEVGQWLWVVDISDPTNPQRIASQLAVPDFAAAVTMLKYSDGRVFAGVNTSEVAVIYRIALQTFILGSNYTNAEFAAAPPEGFSGVDIDDNGDFVGPGEQLPIPEKRTLFGLEITFPLASQRFLNDFDTLAGGGFLVTTFADRGTVAPARLQVVTFGGQFIGNGSSPTGAAEIGGVNATRVLLEPGFEVQTQTGTGSIGLAALVAAGPKVFVYDIGSNPEAPVLVRSVELPPNSGTIISLVRDGPGRYIAGTQSKLFVFDRKLMGAPQLPPGQPSGAVVGSFSLQSVGRSVGLNDAFVVGLVGGSLSAQARAPRISVVRIPSKPVVDVTTIAALPNAEEFAADLLAGAVESTFLTPSPLRAFGTAFPSALANPPPPQFQYYALVRASGALGQEIKLAIESTDRKGRRLPPRGNISPPVILTGHPGAAGVENAQPAATAQIARRLSNDPQSDFYNLYLSQPLLVARDPVSPTLLGAIAAVPGRQAVQMGERLRISLEDATTTAGFGALFTFTPSPDQPPSGLSHSVDSFCADFVDSLNPSMRSASPRVDGVSLQSGEFSHRASDLMIEGRGLDLVVSRNYQSQTHYRGAFGRGWDSPLFQRLCELPSGLVPAEVRLPLTFYGVASKDQIARPGDVMVQDGAGDLKLYRQISAANGNLNLLPAFQNDPAVAEFRWSGKIAVFYAPPPGEFDMLVRFTDGSFVSIDPQATRHYYDAEGRVTRIASAYDEAQWKFEYRADGKLAKVVGDNGVDLQFGYYGRTTAPDFVNSLDKPFPDEARLGLIARIKAGAENVEYTYDANASLTKVESLSSTPEIYGYDTAAPFLLTVIGQQDGTQGPSQKITYVDGLVTQVETDGVARTFGGALATAEARQTAGNTNVTATTGSSTVKFGVETSGLPTSFAGKDVSTSADGQIQMFGSGNDALENMYDIGNAVFRFRGNLLMVKGAGGQSTGGFNYDGTAWNRLLSRTTPEGVTTTYAYVNSAGHNPATQVTMTTGPVTRRTTLNDWGQVVTDDSSEAGVTFRKTTLFTGGLPTGLREGSVDTISMTRASGAKLASVTHGGVPQTPTIDSQGQITGIGTGTGGPSMTIGYDVGSGNLSSASVSGGTGAVSETLTPMANDPDRLSSFTFTQTGVPTESGNFTYDPHGQLTGYSGPGETVSMTYDGVLPKTYDAPGEHYNATYGTGGRLATIKQNGLDATMGYDGQGRPTSMTHGGTMRTLTYNGGRQIATETVTDATGTPSSLQFSYDGAGRLKEVIGSTVTKAFEYFPDGTARIIKLGGFEVSHFTRDSGGFLTDATFFDGAVRISLQDLEPVFALPRRQTSTYINGQSVSETMTYDGFGRVKSQQTGSLAQSVFGYDEFGSQTSATDPDGIMIGGTFSPTGLPLTKTFADGTSVSIAYDSAWNVQQRGNIGFGYNSEGLISSVTYPDGSTALFTGLNSFLEATSVKFGSLTQTHSYTDGRRTGISAAGDSLSAGYDGLGRVTSLTVNGYTVTYRYSPDLGLKSEESPLGRWEIAFNANGQIISETYPSGVSSSFNPGVAGLMTQHTAAGANIIEWADLEVLRSVTYANGIKMTRQFDSAMRPFKITWEKGGNLVAGLEWDLTDGGRVLSEKRLHSGRFDVYQRNTPAQGMRIVGANFNAADATGAGAAQTISGVTFSNGEISFASSSASGAGAAATVPLPVDVLAHDDRGVVTAAPVWVHRAAGLQRVDAQFDYDGFLQLRTIRLLDPNGNVQVTVRYERDGPGRIVRRTVTGDPSVCEPGEWRYSWHDEQLIEEYQVVSGQNRLAARYFWAIDDLVRIDRAATPGGALDRFVPVCGLNGSVTAYLDDNGVMLEEIRYGLYGLPEIRNAGGIVPRSVIDGRLLFQGAFFEREAGLYDMGRRTLHAVFGEFLQRDSELYINSQALYTAFDGDSASNIDREGTTVEKLDLGKSAGWWTPAVTAITKGGVVSEKGNWKFKKNSKLIGFSSKALEFASEFLPEGSLGQRLVAGAGTVAGVLKYGVEAVETIYKMKDTANLVKKALNVESGIRQLERANDAQWRRLYIIMPTERREQLWRDQLSARKHEIAAAGEEAKGVTKRYRMEQRLARLAAAKFGVGLAGAFYESAFKPKDGRISEGYELGVGAFKEAGILLDLARLNTGRKLGQLTGKAELTFGGGYLSGEASAAGMRLVTNVQFAQLGFQAAFEGTSRIGLPLFLRFTISPEASADYRAMAQQFRDDGGFGLKLLGGFLNDYGLISDDTNFKLLILSDYSLAGFIKK